MPCLLLLLLVLLLGCGSSETRSETRSAAPPAATQILLVRSSEVEFRSSVSGFQDHARVEVDPQADGTLELVTDGTSGVPDLVRRLSGRHAFSDLELVSVHQGQAVSHQSLSGSVLKSLVFTPGKLKVGVLPAMATRQRQGEFVPPAPSPARFGSSVPPPQLLAGLGSPSLLTSASPPGDGSPASYPVGFNPLDYSLTMLADQPSSLNLTLAPGLGSAVVASVGSDIYLEDLEAGILYFGGQTSLGSTQLTPAQDNVSLVSSYTAILVKGSSAQPELVWHPATPSGTGAGADLSALVVRGFVNLLVSIPLGHVLHPPQGGTRQPGHPNQGTPGQNGGGS